MSRTYHHIDRNTDPSFAALSRYFRDLHVEATDRQIDEPVYELYGFTEEEITLVDGEHQSR